MMERVAVKLVLVLPLVVAAGCAVGPGYERQAPPQETRYLAAPAALPSAGPSDVSQRIAGSGVVPESWWQGFGSAPLDDLVNRALTKSPTLETARATLAAAKEAVVTARGALVPQIDVGATASRNKGSAQLSASSGATSVFSVGPNVSFPLDVFRGLRRRVEQVSAQADVQRAALGAAYLSLSGNVVTQAINVASAAEQLSAVAEIIAIDERNLELTKLAAAAGKSAQLDVLIATSQLASDGTLLPPLRQAHDAAWHALSVLTGEAPGAETPPEFRLGELTLPGELPLVLPAELVRSRPDIVAAEAQLHAANAGIGIATAQLYPAFTISGSWNREAIRGAGLFDTTANLWNIAAGLTAPIFHGGALRAQRRAAVDTYAAELGTYRETVLQAFGQVADVLAALGHDAEAIAAQRVARDASQASLELTQQGYQAGFASLVQVLDAQRLFQQARLGYARAQAQRYLDTVQLYVAMGGGTRVE